ncbi:MAG TPA: Asp-tRNA(Asn)/Glu-tRNA(Gln) amidotransferase subunit GatA [Candidatus Paceibacterota bacterium]
MAIDLRSLTITSWCEQLASGEARAIDLVAAYQVEITRRNGELNAYLEVFDDARAAAEESDRWVAAGKAPRPLEGVPLAIKDNILIEGEICSAASKMLASYRATYSATVINRLRQAGAIILGRTNMDEFAMGSSTENSAFGPTRHPNDPTRVPGGSSGGTAAAVAAHLALAGLGSDTAGSVRQPASFCGLVGLKPTYGAVSRFGLIAMASSLDQIGPITKTVADAEIIFSVIRGRDDLDATTVEYPRPQEPLPVVADLRLGVPENLISDRVSEAVKQNFDQALEVWRALGVKVVPINLPRLVDALAAYYIISPAEVSSNLARFDGMRYADRVTAPTLLEEYERTRGEGFGQEVRRRIILGTYVLSSGYYDAYYRRALVARAFLTADFLDAFKQVDAVVMPTTPSTAFALGEKTISPLQMYLADIFTVPANIAGLPALTLPQGEDEQGLPCGFQFITPLFREDLLFYLGKQHANLSA